MTFVARSTIFLPATATRPRSNGESTNRKNGGDRDGCGPAWGSAAAARDRHGLSRQAVAHALGLPRAAITQLETGARAVSTLEITKLANLYGQMPAYFLASNEQEAEDLFVVLHRVLPEIEETPQIEGEVRRILDLYREGATLRSLLDQASEQTVPNYASKLSSVGDAIRQGEVVAQEERRRLGLGTAPIIKPRRRSARKACGRRRRTCQTVFPVCS